MKDPSDFSKQTKVEGILGRGGHLLMQYGWFTELQCSSCSGVPVNVEERGKMEAGKDGVAYEGRFQWGEPQ